MHPARRLACLCLALSPMVAAPAGEPAAASLRARLGAASKTPLAAQRTRESLEAAFPAPAAAAVAILQGDRRVCLATRLGESGGFFAKTSLLNAVPAPETADWFAELAGGARLPLQVFRDFPEDDLTLLTLRPNPVGSAADFGLPDALSAPATGSLLMARPDPAAVHGVMGLVSVEAREIPEDGGMPASRLRRMEQFHERAGTKLSARRTGFPRAFETDLDLSPEQCGTPVFDIDGRLVGIAIARATLSSTLVIPAGRLRELLAEAAPR